MKLDNQKSIVFKQKYQELREVALGARAYRIENKKVDKTVEFSKILGKISLNAKEVPSKKDSSEISKSSENKSKAINHTSLIKSLSINHLRSKVGEVVENDSLNDLDKNGVISFNDISRLVNQMQEGDLKLATELAFQGIRSRVGQMADNKSNSLYDLNNDGVISMADLSHLRNLLDNNK